MAINQVVQQVDSASAKSELDRLLSAIQQFVVVSANSLATMTYSAVSVFC